ncbi:MAG: hypothetical protein EZS28_026586 [Streblomastix strix]|uniref:Uncharacterized protein n=1 Tax=Streblomastix strix TaxID=222440 RepID=A0A5J4V532_9EUKA|nr:MAG: hypothetical protein EZS28_026586 [Streblomastix strix]
MKQPIIDHLKSITSDHDEWTRSASIYAIDYLAQNKDNYTEIMKGFDPLAVIQDLSLPIIGNEEERKQIQHKKNLDFVLLKVMINKEGYDNSILLNLIEAGITETLLNFFQTQDLNIIFSTSVKIFDQLQSYAKTQIEQLKKEKKFYPSIIRLFGSSDLQVLSETYDLIKYDIAVGADSASNNSQNLLFKEISECGGDEQKINSKCLKALARIAGNHEEILKDDFISKAVQFISKSSDTFLFEFLEIIINVGTQSTISLIKQEFPVAKIKDLYQHKDSKIREKAFLILTRINNPEQMKKLEIYQDMIKNIEQDQQPNLNIHDLLNDVCIAIQEGSDNYEEKGGLVLIGIRIVKYLVKNLKDIVYKELEDRRFIDQILKPFAVKVPDEIRFSVIDELKQMSQYGSDLEIVRLSAIALSMLAESEQNHTDIIAGGFPNIISRFLTYEDIKVIYSGLALALNLLYFGSEQTKQKVKQAVPLNIVRQLTQSRYQNDAMTAQLLDEWIQFIS